mmetsp:Transcript_14464/g.24527  ORF Transcript_14464/g.24527 Transcript_14464/m.24527 type:complete len:409 (+) Transcript_14464:473-1699(+)
MKPLRAVGSGIFCFLLFWAIIFNFVSCLCFSLPQKCGCISMETSEGLALLSLQFWMRFAVRPCFWVRSLNITPEAWQPFLEELKASDEEVKNGKERRPLYLMSNHVSFLDALIIAMNLPWPVLWRCRCYMAAHLLEFPLFGTTCRLAGHFPVHFLKNEAGKFSVDKERMRAVEERVSAHFKSGGIVALFPEGNLNRGDPSVLQTFRHGTFKRALKEDASIWFFCMAGHADVWPPQQALALWPGRTGFGLFRVFEFGQGAVEAVAQAKVDAVARGGGPSSEAAASTDDGVFLAEHCRIVMAQKLAKLETSTKQKRGMGGGCCYVGCGDARTSSELISDDLSPTTNDDDNRKVDSIVGDSSGSMKSDLKAGTCASLPGNKISMGSRVVPSVSNATTNPKQAPAGTLGSTF